MSSIPQRLIRARLDRNKLAIVSLWRDLAALLLRLRAVPHYIDSVEDAALSRLERYTFRRWNDTSVTCCDYQLSNKLSVRDTIFVLLRRIERLHRLITSDNHATFWSSALEFVVWCDIVRTAAAVVTTFVCPCFCTDTVDEASRRANYETVESRLRVTQRDYLAREINMHVCIELCDLIELTIRYWEFVLPLTTARPIL